MTNLNESQITQAEQYFRGIYELDEKIEACKAQIKDYNSSKTEMIKNFAKTVEATSKGVKEGYRQWKLGIKEEGVADEANTLVLFMKEVGLKIKK